MGGLACHQVNRLSSAAAPARKPQVIGKDEPSLAALEKPFTRPNRPAEARSVPGMSSLGR